MGVMTFLVRDITIIIFNTLWYVWSICIRKLYDFEPSIETLFFFVKQRITCRYHKKSIVHVVHRSSHQLPQVAGWPPHLRKSKTSLDALQVLARHLVSHHVAPLARMQLLSRASLVDTHHGHADGPRRLADAEPEVSVIGVYVPPLLRRFLFQKSAQVQSTYFPFLHQSIRSAQARFVCAARHKLCNKRVPYLAHELRPLGSILRDILGRKKNKLTW